MDTFPEHLDEWRKVFESETPQKERIPLGGGPELSRMQARNELIQYQAYNLICNYFFSMTIFEV